MDTFLSKIWCIIMIYTCHECAKSYVYCSTSLAPSHTHALGKCQSGTGHPHTPCKNTGYCIWDCPHELSIFLPKFTAKFCQYCVLPSMPAIPKTNSRKPFPLTIFCSQHEKHLAAGGGGGGGYSPQIVVGMCRGKVKNWPKTSLSRF